MSREFEKLDNSCNIFIFNDNNYSYYKPFIDFTHINKLNKKLEFKQYNNIYIDGNKFQKKNSSNNRKSFNDVSNYINSFKVNEKDFFSIKSEDESVEFLDKAVYLLNITISRQNKKGEIYFCYAMAHIMLDYYNQIHFFYKLLKDNPNYPIIIDYPFDKKYYEGKNIGRLPLDSCAIINKFIQYIRDLKLINNIITIWDKKIVIKNLYSIQYNENNGEFNKLTMQNFTTPFCNFNSIINKNTTKYEKKFFILEVRPIHSRGIPVDINNEIIELCKLYSNRNNLELIIWSFDFVGDKSIYEQNQISSNAEIIITFGGSMSYFCHTIQKGNVLVLNLKHEGVNAGGKFEEETPYTKSWVINSSFYNQSHFYKNQNVNTFLKFLVPGAQENFSKLPEIINKFFTKL
jgi:hypothetical protein